MLLADMPRWIADPTGLTASFNDSPDVLLTDVRGIEYDAATDTTFVTMLGYSGGSATAMNFKILALDGFTPTLKGIQSFTYGADMHVTGDGRVLVGSWTQTPGIFATSDLAPGGSLQGPQALFITAVPVPEPTPLLMMAAGLAMLGYFKRFGRKSASA